MVFYYYSNHAVPVGRFKGRVQWRGDTSCGNGSIQLQDVHVNDSGTYECEVRLLQASSIFRNQTVLHVSSTALKGGAGAAGTGGFISSGVWLLLPSSVTALAGAPWAPKPPGLCPQLGAATHTALERTGNTVSKNKAEEALYCSIPVPEIPKAQQDAKKKKRAEDTYITMHPSHCRENGVYVELSRRVIPAEWMGEGRQADGQTEEPHNRPQEALPWAPEGQK
ncbi:Junctional adhesion molecule-like [Acanthisitta chloris]|uniref:Junctional adhesion molecule-like n=1 Tax=Acanthisitta chloris TaxID=57068 RepID=A0A091MV59_9PASS|nr:Junctional adhesion molecule-like [Acanthisitta chloris]